MTEFETWLEKHPEGVRPERVAADFLCLKGPAALVRQLAVRALHGAGAAECADGLWRLFAIGQEREVALVVASLDERVVAAMAPVGEPSVLIFHGSRAEVAGRVRSALMGATPVIFSAGRDAAWLVLDKPIVLAPALRRAGLIGALDGIPEAAEALALPVPEATPGDLVRTVAQLRTAALEGGVSFEPAPPPPGFDFESVAFGPDDLDALPSAPGVYRFLDEDGEVLYVGKAKDLRSRVRSYFVHKSQRRHRYAELVDRLHDLEWEETGSELRALLLETEQIRELEPPINVQMAVRRNRPKRGNLVLFLPGEEEGAVDLLLVRDGAPAGRVMTDRRARGMREIRSAIGRVFFDGFPVPPADPADAQIVQSWLRAKHDGQNLLDLSLMANRSEAARLVKAYLTDPDLFDGKILHT